LQVPIIPSIFVKNKLGMVGTIYRFESPSGKSYIGQTVDARRRKAEFTNFDGKYSGKKFDNARRKYGPDSFKYEVLIQLYNIDREELRRQLDEMEIYFIKKYDSYHNGYNMTEGGSGSKGCFQTEESRKKISLKAIGKPGTFKGKHHSEETKKLLSEYAKTRIGSKNPFYGKKCPESTKEALRKANGIPVIQLDLEGNFIKEFPTARDAANSFGKPRANSDIIKVCKNYVSPSGKHYKTALGYKWKYKESSTTIPKGSTLQANGNGNGEYSIE
jgi:group I intron endonuclease